MRSKTSSLVVSLFGLWLITWFPGQAMAKGLWTFEAGEKITGTPCVTEDAVYVTTWLDHLIALDRTTGGKRWEITLDGHIPGAAAFDGGTLFVPSYRGKLYAIDPKTGDEKWVFDMDCSRLYTTPVVAGGIVYLGDRCGNFFAINAETGKEIARNHSINWVMGSAAVDGDTVYLGRMDWSIYAYDARTLQEIWRYGTRTSVLSTPVYDDEKLYCGSDDGNLYALDKKTGLQRWRFQTAGWIQCRPTLHEKNVIFSSFDGTVYCLEADYGRPIWHFRTNNQVSSSVVIHEGLCYFGGRDGFLYCLDVDTGQLQWRMDTGAPILSTPVIEDGKIYCTTTGGSVIALNINNPPKTVIPMGEPNWAKVPATAALGQAPELTTSDKTRILFLDLAELEEVDGLVQVLHEGQKVSPDPVLVGTPGTWDATRAKVYGDIHHDPATGKWKMWYTGTEDSPASRAEETITSTRHIGFATSDDGIHWKKPILGRIQYQGSKNNNLVLLDGQLQRVLDVSRVPGAKHRWRLYVRSFWADDRPGEISHHHRILESDDCFDWTSAGSYLEHVDTSNLILDFDDANPKHRFKAYGQYTFRMKNYRYDRQLAVMTSEDGLKWDQEEPKIILSSGELGVADSEEHFLGVTKYGQYYIALYDAMYDNHSCDTEMALSRDGINFKRVLPGRKFINLGKFGDYDSSMITVSSSFVTTADKHYQYYSASRMNYQEGVGWRSGLMQPWRRTTGLRVWRRDGFTSLAVPTGHQSGKLLTKPIDVKEPAKNRLVLNLHVPDSGTASVSIIDHGTGEPVVGYENSDPISGVDRIDHTVTFGSLSDLTGLAKVKKVRLRISLTGPESQIYSMRFQQE